MNYLWTNIRSQLCGFVTFSTDVCIAIDPNHSKMTTTSLVRPMRRNSFEDLVFQ